MKHFLLASVTFISLLNAFEPSFTPSKVFNDAQKANVIDDITNENLPSVVNFIEYCFTDPIEGKLKSVTYPVASLESAQKHGVSFDGSSIRGFTRILDSDLLLKPDINAATGVLPWTQNSRSTIRIISDIYTENNKPCSADPRFVLKNELAKAEKRGYVFNVGTELEFFFIDGSTGRPFDHNKYFDAPAWCSLQSDIADFFNIFSQIGINVEKFHHEVAPGQLEMSLAYGNALKIADNVILFKHTLKQLGYHFKMLVSFMAKPFEGVNGSGMHIHFSLFDKEKNKNAFYDEKDSNNLSPLGKSFIAGILNRIRELTLLFNYNINSYKRLIPGFEAPVYVCCGKKNRSALVRLPMTDSPNAVRAELRSPDAMCNPYLAFAALLKAGLEGIDKNLQLPDIVADNLYEASYEKLEKLGIKTLPSSLTEAVSLFAQSEFAHKLLGDQLFNEIIKYKREEIQSFRQAVTDWEFRRYHS